jgi:4-amino-4-deoxy-L-arabinose transferase-like glycosyltransferase
VFLARSVHDGDATLRVPSAIAGVAAVGVFYAWSSRWLGGTTARVAAVLLALDPLHIHYSQEVRNYSFVFLFAMIACYAFDRFCERARWGNGVAYVLAVAAAALSNFTAAFVFAAHTVIYFVRGGIHRHTVRRWVYVCLAVLVLISPWVYRIYTYIDVSDLVTPVMPGEIDTSERLRGETTVTWAAVPYSFYTFSVGFTLGPSLRELHEDASLSAVLSRHAPAVLVVALLFGGAALVGLRRVDGRVRVELLLYLVLPIAFTLLLNWQNAKAFNARYVLLSLPAFLCIVAAGSRGRRGRWPAAACAVVMVVSLWHCYYDGRYAKEDVRRATRYIAERLDTEGSDGCVLAPTVFQIVERYYPGPVPVKTVYARGTGTSLDAQLDSVFAACNSVWYVRARPWEDDPDGRIERAVDARYRAVERQDFDGVKVTHYIRENPDDKSP